MRVLVTGATGFIGNYFIEKCKKKYTIKSFSLSKNSLDTLDLKVTDVVLHLGAYVHHRDTPSSQEYYRVNVKQSLALARKAKKEGVKHFIFMSSISVYGVESGTIDEKTPCNPLSDYGKSKLEAEQELLKLVDKTFRVTNIRPPLVYGYNAPGNMKSLINLIKKVPFLPFGKINNRRSMIYVGNLAYFIEIIIKKQSSGVFLVADGEALSTTRLIELIAGALERKIYLLKVPFFESLLKLLKPSFYKRLFLSLEINNKETVHKLFGSDGNPLPYSVEEGIKLMIEGEQK